MSLSLGIGALRLVEPGIKCSAQEVSMATLQAVTSHRHTEKT